MMMAMYEHDCDNDVYDSDDGCYNVVDYVELIVDLVMWSNVKSRKTMTVMRVRQPVR